MKPKRKILRNTLALLVIVAFTAIVLNGCTKKSVPLETVRIGISKGSPTNVLIYVADEKGFFKREGVNATLDFYDTGPTPVNNLLSGTLEVAQASDFVMVRKSFENSNLRVFAQICNSNIISLVARRDRGITKLSDLKGKKVGIPRGSVSEFFLGSFVRHSRIPLSSVRVVDVAPLDSEEALSNGSVDAVVTSEPMATRIEERLEKNAIKWPVQGKDDFYSLLITNEEFLGRSPATAERLLRALIAAEDFVAQNPEEALKIVESRLNLSAKDVQLVWAKSKFKVRLDQGLLPMMEAEADWMMRNNLTKNKQVPNYLNMIDLKPLEAVKPEAVAIIH